jgi:hypothetical protein
MMMRAIVLLFAATGWANAQDVKPRELPRSVAYLTPHLPGLGSCLNRVGSYATSITEAQSRSGSKARGFISTPNAESPLPCTLARRPNILGQRDQFFERLEVCCI